MPSPIEIITPALLREWALPRGADSKYARGTVLVIGGARQTPGAALLAGTAALRVGAGRLSLAVAESVSVPLAIAVPESGVTGLAETDSGSLRGDDAEKLAQNLEGAKAIVVGSGLDDGDEAERLVRRLLDLVGPDTQVLLDAYALGVAPRLADELTAWHGRLVLTPNKGEASRLLERDIRTDGDGFIDDLAEVAERYGAVITCFGSIASSTGKRWRVGSGQGGLGTSGSGDVLAGAIGGLLARGASPEQAACWGTHLHAAAGDRLTARVGPTGYLARELVDGLPEVLAELGQLA
jgi:hydroxyethylthiazole kinase-like uncharacterized protein yjeF